MNNKFICPECGSQENSDELFISKEPILGASYKKDPWNGVLQQMECVSCNMVIPAHLGQRWNNISIEQAQQEWKAIYKKNNKKQKN
jgi:hypothetical protein